MPSILMMISTHLDDPQPIQVCVTRFVLTLMIRSQYRYHTILLYRDLKYAIVIGPTCITWCTKINNIARFRHCSVMFPGNMTSYDPCSRGTWRKPRDTMYLRRFFGPTAVLGRSIRILCCCVMDDDTDLLHLFRHITKQILPVILGQHWKIMPLSCSMLPSDLWPLGNIAQLCGANLIPVNYLFV